MTRVLVTGATGFLGRSAVELLRKRGHEVHAVARTAGTPAPGVTWHTADLLDPIAANCLVTTVSATHLLHFAWYAVPGLFWAAAENERWVDATLHLFDRFATEGGVRAVMAGTCAEYRWDSAQLQELSSPIEPATLYGRCKAAAHSGATQLAIEHGISLAWGRIFFLYGPAEHPSRLVASVARELLRGERVATTEGSQVRDFLHVSDVAGAFATLLESQVEGPVNIASGLPCTVKEVITLIAAAAGGLDRVDFGSLPMRANDPARIVANPTRLSDEVGFQPRITLADGLGATVDWWREHITDGP